MSTVFEAIEELEVGGGGCYPGCGRALVIKDHFIRNRQTAAKFIIKLGTVQNSIGF